jgi:hypothetical protein
MTQRQRSQLKELLLIEANKESIQHKSHHFYLYLLIKRLVLTSLKELQSLKRIKLEVSLSPPPQLSSRKARPKRFSFLSKLNKHKFLNELIKCLDMSPDDVKGYNPSR